MYDPSLGRWLEEDPLGFEAGDANLYRYVDNGPTNGVDPSGLLKDWPLTAVAPPVEAPKEAPAQAEITQFYIEDENHVEHGLLGDGKNGIDITELINNPIKLKAKVSVFNPKSNHLSHTISVEIRSGWPPDDLADADAFQGGLRTDPRSRGQGTIELPPGKQDFVIASSSYQLNGKRTHFFEVIVIDTTYMFQTPYPDSVKFGVLAKLRVRGFVK